VAEQHKTDHTILYLDLPGLYQSKNLLTVLEVCSQLQARGWHIDHSHINKALRQVKKMTGLHGRWDIIHTDPLVVLDVGHNEDGMKQIVRQVELTDHHELHIIIGMVNDKDIDRALMQLPQTAHYYFTNAAIPRALRAATLQEKANAFGLQGQTYDNVNTALKEARSRADDRDLIIVCGSVFLVAEVMV
jgi:dihydrofolate synthase/folylpolyglutamate synthase